MAAARPAPARAPGGGGQGAPSGANGAGVNGAGVNGAAANRSASTGTAAKRSGVSGAGANGAGVSGAGANSAGANGGGANGTGQGAPGGGGQAVPAPAGGGGGLITGIASRQTRSAFAASAASRSSSWRSPVPNASASGASACVQCRIGSLSGRPPMMACAICRRSSSMSSREAYCAIAVTACYLRGAIAARPSPSTPLMIAFCVMRERSKREMHENRERWKRILTLGRWRTR